MKKTLLESLDHKPQELAFGTSGLRGLVTNMTDLECYINTKGFIDFLLQTGDINPGTHVALAGDLRQSTPRILLAVAHGILDSSCKITYLGLVPTPTAAYYGVRTCVPVAMVTGSHIPADRNGIKFYKKGAEALKEDEAPIKAAVAAVRQEIYNQPINELFNKKGELIKKVKLPPEDKTAARDFLQRYTSLFGSNSLSGKQLVVYQHSSLAADMLVELLENFGAVVIAVDKSDRFIPIDTENITLQNQAYFKNLAKKYPQNFAIVSADGDADRPFVVDETGIFHRGDILGALTAAYLKARSAVVTISSNDAVDTYLSGLGIEVLHTKIGSPYVVSGMQEAKAKGLEPTVGWEVNGGFMTGSDIGVNNKVLKALATRDAFLPIVCALMAAAEVNCKLSELFASLPQRFTQAGLLDNFPTQISQAILAKYAEDSPITHRSLEKFFKSKDGFDKVIGINNLDGIRITFAGGDIAHVRPSGNAPQLRIYSVANSQKRADEIVALALIEPGGILRQLEASV